MNQKVAVEENCQTLKVTKETKPSRKPCEAEKGPKREVGARGGEKQQQQKGKERKDPRKSKRGPKNGGGGGLCLVGGVNYLHQVPGKFANWGAERGGGGKTARSQLGQLEFVVGFDGPMIQSS